MNTQGGGEQFQYHPGGQLQQPAVQPPATSSHAEPESTDVIQWNASEFVDHHKNFGWFGLLALGTLILCGAIYFITKSIFSTAVVLVAALAFGVYARQKPRTLTYRLTPSTITIGEKTYSYDDFRSFSVHQEGALYNVILQPVKRFMPSLTIYFPQDEGEKIFDALATHLPAEERQTDPIDNLMRKIRF